jgi:putative addiction module component (TIGR02574 family)
MQIDQLAHLPIATRLQAMEVIWDSFSYGTPSQSEVVPDWHQDVLSQRMARLRSGAEKTMPWQQAKAQLREMTAG